MKSHSSQLLIIIFIHIVILFSFSTAVLALSAMDSTASAPEKNSMWFRGANMPTPRSDFTGAVLNGKVYIIGGFNNEGKTTNVVEYYDPKTHSWGTGPSLPERLNHAAAASYNGKLYVVGGYRDEYDARALSNELFIYDSSIDKWQKGEPLPTARGALTANFINGILYAVGGVDKLGVSDSNTAYDPIANLWTEKKPMPTAREHLSSAVVDKNLFVIGGRVGGLEKPMPNLDVNEVYDPIKDNWTSLEPMPTKRGGLAAAGSSPIDGNIYVFGGEEPGGVFNNNEKYNPHTNKWTEDVSMPTARHGLAAVTVDDKIYVVGGGLEPGASVSGLNEIFHMGKSEQE